MICTRCLIEKEVGEFTLRKDTGKYRKACRACVNSSSNSSRKLRVEDNRIKVLEYLGGEYKCRDCGVVNKYSGMFDWHHIVQEEKEGEIGNLISRPWGTLKKELDKCIFLCANCHRLRHCPVV